MTYRLTDNEGNEWGIIGGVANELEAVAWLQTDWIMNPDKYCGEPRNITATPY